MQGLPDEFLAWHISDVILKLNFYFLLLLQLKNCWLRKWRTPLSDTLNSAASSIIQVLLQSHHKNCNLSDLPIFSLLFVVCYFLLKLFCSLCHFFTTLQLQYKLPGRGSSQLFNLKLSAHKKGHKMKIAFQFPAAILSIPNVIDVATLPV